MTDYVATRMTRPGEHFHTLFEFRSAEVETVGRFTRIEGRAVPYNTWANAGFYLEQFKPRAFAKSIREAAKPLPLMLFHGRDDMWPIGISASWDDREDSLYGAWQLNDSPNAQRAAAMAKSGELGYLSVGFMDVRSTVEQSADSVYQPLLGEDHMDRFTRIEARLVETSIVPTPAYADAQVLTVRNYRRPQAAQPRLHAYRQQWERERANLPG